MNPYTPPAADFGQDMQPRHPLACFFAGLVTVQLIWTAICTPSFYLIAATARIPGMSLTAFIGFGLLYAGTFFFFAHPGRGRNLFLGAALILALAHFPVNYRYGVSGPIELGLLAAVLGCWLANKTRGSRVAALPRVPMGVQRHALQARFLGGFALGQFLWTLKCLPVYVGLVSSGIIPPSQRFPA